MAHATHRHCNLETDELAQWAISVKSDKVVELVGGGSVIIGATPSSLFLVLMGDSMVGHHIYALTKYILTEVLF